MPLLVQAQPGAPGRRTRRIRALQKIEEDKLERPVGRDRLVLNPQIDAGSLNLRGMSGKLSQIPLASRRRVDVQAPCPIPRRETSRVP